MKNRIMILSAIVGLLVVAQPAMAVNLWCTGTVKRLYVDTGGRAYVYATWRGGYTMICDLNETWKGVTQDVCKNWFAMLQGAYHAQTNVIVFYTGVSEASCTEFPTYGGAPGPGYVMNRE